MLFYGDLAIFFPDGNKTRFFHIAGGKTKASRFELLSQNENLFTHFETILYIEKNLNGKLDLSHKYFLIRAIKIQADIILTDRAHLRRSFCNFIFMFSMYCCSCVIAYSFSRHLDIMLVEIMLVNLNGSSMKIFLNRIQRCSVQYGPIL